MKLRHRLLFSVDIRHAYYQGTCRDFVFIVPESTRRLLAAGRLLVDVRDECLRVFFEVGEDDEPVVVLDGCELLFGLGQANPHFFNFTDPVAERGQIALYCNLNSESRVTKCLNGPLSTSISGSSLRVTPLQKIRPVHLAALRGTSTLVSKILGADDDDASFPVDFWPPGIYSLRETYAEKQTDYIFLLAPELASQAIWGALAITIGASFYTETAPVNFSIDMKAREETLKYYIVTKNYSDDEISPLSVVDAGAAEDDRPEVVFGKAPGGNDLPSDLLGDSAARIVLFQSEDPVPRREYGYRKIQLRCNNEVLIKHLPQAGPERPQAHFVVHLSKS
jgi:hypothetical protein